MSKRHTTTTYLILEGRRKQYGFEKDEATGLRPIESVAVVASRQSYPGSLKAGQIVAKITLDVPSSAFDPVVPKVVITVPESMLSEVVEVEVQDANEDVQLAGGEGEERSDN